ncbi:MAG: hypothetical protein ACJAZI_000176, partial [Cycloclasticus sp.]
MANVGTVKSVTGIVKAISEDGSERLLSVGDSVAENEKIITGDGVIVIAFSDGTVMDLGSNSSVVLNDDVLNQGGEQQATQSQEAAEDEVTALQQALANDPNFDPANLPATAAGTPAAGANGNNGHTVVSIDYLNPEAPVEAGFDTVGINAGFLQPDEELLLDIGEPLNPVAVEPEAAVVINGELGYFKEDTANDVTLSASTADSTDELTSLTLSGLTGWSLDGADITALVALADVDTAVFAGGTLTITFVSGVESFNYTALTLTPPADTDADTAVVLTANVQDKTDNSVTNTKVVNDTFEVDAILDDSIDVSSTQTDGTEAVGAQTLSLGLDGSAINPFTGSGNGGEDTDGSESGTVTLTLSSALVADASLSLAGGYAGSVIITDGGDADETTFALSGWTNTADLAAAIDALQVTLPGGFDGDVTGNLAWSFADAGLGGTENDLTDNSDSGNTDFTVSVNPGEVTPTASVTVGEETNVVLEDGSIDVLIEAAAGDATDELTGVTVTLPADWSATDGVNSYTGTFELSASGQSFSQVLTVTPGGEDTDVDGAITAVAHAQDMTDNSVTADSSEASGTVVIDTVLDEAVDVADGSNTGNAESASIEVHSLNLAGTVVSPYGQTDGAPADSTETGTASINNLTTGAVLGTWDGATFTATALTFTGTAGEVDAWLESLAVQVAAGFEGSITGDVSVTFTDTATADGNPDTVNDTYTDTASFTVEVEPGQVAPTASVTVGEETNVVLEDGSIDVLIEAAAGDATDELTGVTVTLPADWSATDGVNSYTGTFELSASGQSFSQVLTVTPGGEDTDVDGAITAVAHAQDMTDNSVTADSSEASGTVVIDTVLDEAVDVADGSNTGNAESASIEVHSLNLAGTVVSPYGQTDGAPADSTETGTASINNLTTGAVLGTWDGATFTATALTFTGTAGEVDAWLESLAVQVAAGFDGSIGGDVSVSFTDTATADGNPNTVNDAYTDTASFTVEVIDSVPSNPVNDLITVEEESIPGFNGNDEADGLSYTINGTFSDNADWGVDGFGGIVSVNGVTPSSDTININNSNWTLTVNATTGSYTFTLLSNINSTPFGDNLEGTNDLPIFNVIGQDGDGSQIGFGLEVGIVDDIPTITATQPDEATYEFTITNHDEVSSAGHHNSYGYYIKDATGAPTTGVVVWDDVHDADTVPVTVSGFTPDQIGFFIIPNGENNNTGLDDNTPVTFKFVDGSGVEVPVGTTGGQWQAFSDAGSTALSGTGSHVFFDNADLNSDAQDHAVDNGLIGNQNWEDLLIPNGDGDFNDVNINVEWNLVTAAPLTVDETELADDSELTTASATMNVAGSFDISPGADGLGSVTYVLGLVSQGVDSGLVDTLSEESILLRTTVDGDVEGYVADGVVFTLNVEANGDVTLTQLRAVVHGNPEDYDEAVTAATIADGLIALTATVTDSDGDTAYDSIDVGALIAFEDDGPKSLNPTTSHLKDMATSPDVVQLLNFAAGADGVEAVVFDT